MGDDLGALIANLVLNYVSHFAHTPNAAPRKAYQEYLLDTILSIWQQFTQKFETLWQANNTGELVPNGYWDYPGVTRLCRLPEKYPAPLLQAQPVMARVRCCVDMGSSRSGIFRYQRPDAARVVERYALRIVSRC